MSKIKLKELSRLGYTNNVARSLAVELIDRNAKHAPKDEIVQDLAKLLDQPADYIGHPIWDKLALHFCPPAEQVNFTHHDLNEAALAFKTYGGKHIDTLAKQQMELAMRLPISLQGSLMPDAHAGYGLPIGGVLATNNVVIPYAVGMDIGCRMALTIFEEPDKYVQRYAHSIKTALADFTHFGMEGGLTFAQEHEVLDSDRFQQTSMLRQLHPKAVRQLGSSGGGNHFVEFGSLELFADNHWGLPAGGYLALLSHSGSRGMGAHLAQHYSQLARERCKLPREAQHFAWLDMDSEEGQEYWLSMNLAGDYAKACHERIHINLAKALGIKPLTTVDNHHNFAWKECLADGREAIVHRKGATPAQAGVPGVIPGSMTAPGYLVVGKGVADSLQSASHGAGRALSRSRAKASFTQSSLKKLLSEAGVSLIGGSVEEAPLAYKDIDMVMSTQKDLVEVQGKFLPKIVRMNKE